MRMKKVIFHGHFYQPPRENPWTGVIENQKEAAPFDNWNKRISRECYEANAFSPLLDAEGRVERFFNNYEHISFNIGPTLLSWLEQEAPHVYEKIREGDRRSLQKRGSGNAIAQVYNHIILPLASERDRKTQIIWSLEDFKRHFSRDPRGLWLSETAICPETAEEMVRNGIEYTILSPDQAERFIFSDAGYGGNTAPEELWRHPWLLDCPSGELRVYFYHPGLSAGISFNHLLRDADKLYTMIKSELRESALLSVATDGEIYGHHEVLGNMGLSAVLAKIENDPETESANFSQLTDSLPPAGYVFLKKGEGGRGSSWSCSHGVSRWYRDCGCTTGSSEGWNQKWRTALREAFDELNRRAEKVFRDETVRLVPSADPDTLRNAYISVLTGRRPVPDFLNSYALSRREDRMKLLRLLDGQKYAMYMFTSCGWFFADITGVEPRQNILYAARLLALYRDILPPLTEKEFQNTLGEALSNLPEMKNGADLYREDLEKTEGAICRRAASLILEELYGLPSGHSGCLEIAGVTIPDRTQDKVLPELRGNAVLKDRETGEARNLDYSIREDKISFTNMHLRLENKSFSVSLPDLSPEEQRSLLMHSATRFREPSYGAMARLLRRFNDSPASVTAAAHSSLTEILIMMGNSDTAAWSAFSALLSSEIFREIPLPEDFSRRLYNALEGCLSGQKGIREVPLQLLKALPRLSLPAGMPPMSATLAGRLHDLYSNSEEGKRVIALLKEEEKAGLSSLLLLSKRIAF